MRLIDRLAFDEPTEIADPFGGSEVGWNERFKQRATIIYQRGDEAVQAARLAGRPIYKVKMRQSSDARRITIDWRARDIRRGDTSGTFPGTPYNITGVDAVTDRQWIYLTIEGRTA